MAPAKRGAAAKQKAPKAPKSQQTFMFPYQVRTTPLPDCTGDVGAGAGGNLSARLSPAASRQLAHLACASPQTTHTTTANEPPPSPTSVPPLPLCRSALSHCPWTPATPRKTWRQ